MQTLSNLVELEKMLSNAYLLAKFGFDTAENEPAKILQKKVNCANSDPQTDRHVQEGVLPAIERGYVVLARTRAASPVFRNSKHSNLQENARTLGRAPQRSHS